MYWTIQKWKWIYPNYPNWGKQTHFVVSYLRPYRILYPNYSDAGQLRYYLCLVVPFWFRIGWKVTVCNAYGPQPLTCHGLNHLLIIIIAAIIRKIRPHYIVLYITFKYEYTAGRKRPQAADSSNVKMRWLKLPQWKLNYWAGTKLCKKLFFSRQKLFIKTQM